MSARPHPFGPVLTAAVVLAAAISVVTSTPSPLPEVALGSSVLLHVERSVALLAGTLVVLIVVARAWRGDLPTEVSGRGVRYEQLKDSSERLLDHLAGIQSKERRGQERLEERVRRLERGNTER